MERCVHTPPLTESHEPATKRAELKFKIGEGYKLFVPVQTGTRGLRRQD